MSEGLQFSAHLTEMLLPGAQESLSAVTGWVFYCFKVLDPLGLGKGEEGQLLATSEQLQISFCLDLYIFPVILN